MPTPLILKNAYLSIGGTDITAYTRAVTLNIEYEEEETTVMANTARWGVPGMRVDSMEVECNADFTDNLLSEILDGWVGNASVQAIIVKPNGGTTSAANPKWTGNGRIFSYAPISGSVGDLATVKFTVKNGDGTAWVRATAD